MNQEDIIKMAREASVPNSWDLNWFDPYYARFAALVAAAEREACAKLLDEMAAKDKLSNYYKVAALAIRERGAP